MKKNNKKKRVKKNVRSRNINNQAMSERKTEAKEKEEQIQNISLDPKSMIRDVRIIGGAVLFVIVTLMFIVSVNMRSEYKDYVSTDHHHHLTATSMIFTNCWLEDGIVNDHFAMMANPDSVEFSDLKDRSFYDSYPSGCIIPLYILAKITGTEQIDFGFVQRWNLFNQYIVTLLMAFTVYLLVLRLRKRFYIGIIGAIAAASVNLFMPAPFYFFHSVYFADIAVIFPFMLTVFLELVWMSVTNNKLRRIIAVVEGIVIFAGTFTDYLFPCLVLVLYVKRLLMREIRFVPVGKWFIDSLKFAAPAMLALALFGIQLLVNGPVRIVRMFLFRTGIEDGSGWTEHFEDQFWRKYIVDGYGKYADVIIKLSLAIIIAAALIYIIMRIFKKYENKSIELILSVAGIIILPCFIQINLLKNHSAIHDFSTLKFSMVIGVVSYVLIPLLAAEFVCELRKKIRLNAQFVSGLAVGAFAFVCCSSVVSAHKNNAESFFPERTDEYEVMGEFFEENTGYNDVVFSTNYEIYDSNDYPQRLAYCKKRVYKIDSVNQIYNKIKDIDEDYTVNIFSYGADNSNAEIKELLSKAYDVIEGDNMKLYKIDKEAVFDMAGK